MDLTGIISISGKPGLFKVVAKGKNNVIVESLIDGKKIPAYSTDKISALEDISIYTYEEDLPLKDVYDKIYDKESGGKTISHKESANKLEAYTEGVLPNYDKERVYASDLKKLFQWYNLIHSAGLLKKEEPEEKSEDQPKDSKKTDEKESTAKTDKPKAKKAADSKKQVKKKPVNKATPVKKTATAKTATRKAGKDTK